MTPKAESRSLGSVTKERKRDGEAVDRILEKVNLGEITVDDAKDVKENIEFYAKRNEARMSWADETLVETSKARKNIEKSYHLINGLIEKIDLAVVLPVFNGGKKPSKPSSKAKNKEAYTVSIPRPAERFVKTDARYHRC